MTATTVAPEVEALRDHLARQFVIARERSGRDEGRRRVEVRCRQLDLLVDPPHGMTELHAGVPERVPDRTRDRLDLLGHLPRFDVVDEQQVEIALRSQLAAAVSADRQQRDPARRTLGSCDRVVEDRDDPLVGDLRQRPTPVAAGDAGRPQRPAPGDPAEPQTSRNDVSGQSDRREAQGIGGRDGNE